MDSAVERAQRATACSRGRVCEPWVESGRAGKPAQRATACLDPTGLLSPTAWAQARCRDLTQGSRIRPGLRAAAHCVGSAPGLKLIVVSLPGARGLALGCTLSLTASPQGACERP